MTLKPDRPLILGMAMGTTAMLIVMLLALHFRKNENPVRQLARQARRSALAARMQVDLAAASEAEKSAVLAITDEASQAFADQARAATAEVERGRRELGGLLSSTDRHDEKELLAQFTTAFAEFRKIDNNLLPLAVRNTNIKAYSLAFGPSAVALQEMNAALSRLVAANADASEAPATMRLAFGAQISALRIQTLLPQHIMEENDQKEDELEALMAAEDAQVRRGLEGLAALPQFGHDPELAAATARYAEFSQLKKQILALSRENTNLRSLSISLNQKRKVMLVCQDLLVAVQQAILAEPIAGVTYGTPVRPRGW